MTYAHRRKNSSVMSGLEIITYIISNEQEIKYNDGENVQTYYSIAYNKSSDIRFTRKHVL